jgi:hypothetical protein
MSDLKLEKSIIYHKLKLFNMDDIDKTKFTIRPLKETINLDETIEIQNEIYIDSYLIKDKLQVILYERNNEFNCLSADMYCIKKNYFLAKYPKTNVLKIYGMLNNSFEKKHYIVYEPYDFTLDDYLDNAYDFSNNKNIPKLSMNNKKKILLQIIQAFHSWNLLGYCSAYGFTLHNIVLIKDKNTNEYNIKIKADWYTRFIGLDINSDRNNELIELQSKNDKSTFINKQWMFEYRNIFNTDDIKNIATLFILLLDDSNIIINKLSRKSYDEENFFEGHLNNAIIKKKDNNFIVKDIIVNDIIIEKYGNECLDLLKNMYEEDVRIKFNTKQILEHKFWNTNLKGGNNHHKFINNIKNKFKFIENCDSCSSIPISKEIYTKKILESSYFEEVHANYKDVSFKEDNISKEMRIHLFKIFDNVFKHINLNDSEFIDKFLIKNLDGFINASNYMRLFVNLEQKMEISVILFLGLWGIFANKYMINSIFMDYYKLQKYEDSIKYIEIFNKNINIELLLNIEFIPITTHLNYIITKLSYENNEKLVSNKLNIDLVPVYLNLCQYYSSIPNESMDYFTVYEICVLMIISTPLFFNNFKDYDTVDKFIEDPPFDFLKLDLANSRKFIARYMKSKKTLFKLPSSDNDSDLIIDYDFIHLTNSLSGKQLNNSQEYNNLTSKSINIADTSNDCKTKDYDNCKKWRNGCKWTGSKDIGTCFTKDEFENKTKNELCSYKNKEDCDSLIEGMGCNWINNKCVSKDTKNEEKKQTELANNKCSIKERDDCKKWLNGCLWLENTDTDGTCFLKDDLNLCDNIKIEDCDTNPICHKKYDKCVPSNYIEAALLQKNN